MADGLTTASELSADAPLLCMLVSRPLPGNVSAACWICSSVIAGGEGDREMADGLTTVAEAGLLRLNGGASCVSNPASDAERRRRLSSAKVRAVAASTLRSN